MEKRKNFWDKNAGRYDRFMHKDAAAYEQLYELLRPVVRRKTVLELATGTGLIRQKHRKRCCPHRGYGCIARDDRAGEAGQLLRQTAFLRAGHVSPSLCRQKL